MPPVSPELVESVGKLPEFTMCLIALLAQLVAFVLMNKSLRADIQSLQRAINLLTAQLGRRAHLGKD